MITRREIELAVVEAAAAQYFTTDNANRAETARAARDLADAFAEAFIEEPVPAPVSDARNPANLESALQYILSEASHALNKKNADNRALAKNSLVAILDRTHAALRAGPYAPRTKDEG